MIIEELSAENVEALIELVLELWPDCTVDEEYQNYSRIVGSADEICYLVKQQHMYIAFIHLTLRNDYVEGAEELPVAYIEALYVKSNFHKQGIGKKLVTVAQDWSKQKGCKQLASDAELNNSASIAFHKQTGFTEVNRIVCFTKDV